MKEQPIELWAFMENSDFQRRKKGEIIRHDETILIRHDEFLETDYQLLKDVGMIGVRDAARWYVTHPAPHTFDWTWLDRVVAAAEKYDLKLYLDLWHYGYPDWIDLMSDDAPAHFAEFARAIALRYPSIEYYCVSNEPSVLLDWGGTQGRWRPFQRRKDPVDLRRQICRAIIQASRAILDIKPDMQLVLPEPWHARDDMTLDQQAVILDTVMGILDPELGGTSELVTIIGMNHYRDTTLPPFHQLIHLTKKRYPNKPLWLTETSATWKGARQHEWFWWTLAELRLANLYDADVRVFTWAPTISMYDWFEGVKHELYGIWRIETDGSRVPNDRMVESIALAREYGYLV